MKKLKAILVMVDGAVVKQEIIEIQGKTEEECLTEGGAEEALYFFY
jgi:hypothetical protein